MDLIAVWLTLLHGLTDLPHSELCRDMVLKAVVRHEEAVQRARILGSWSARQEAERAERSWRTLVYLWCATCTRYDPRERIYWLLRWRAMLAGFDDGPYVVPP